MGMVMILILLGYVNVINGQPKLVMHQTPVFGNVTLGYYYINLFLGTPPQKQTFILDTGSSIFVVPCKPCTQCGTQHLSPEFDLTKSSTAQRLTCSTGQQICRNCHLKQGNDSCEFITRFVQQSQLQGYYVKDMVLLTSDISLTSQELTKNYDERVKTTFGCITKQTNLFKDQKADGILALSPNSQFNFIKQIYRTHYPFTRQNHTFSICLSSNGGVFTVGGLNTRLHNTGKGVNMRFRKDQNVYSLNVSGIYVGSNNINVSESYLKKGYGIFIDSGATFTYFQHSLYQSIINILEQACLSVGCKSQTPSTEVCYVFPQSKSMSLEDQINRFPNITLKIARQSDINWTSQQYLRPKNISNREMCLAFQRLDRTILGTTWMINKDIHFDMNRQQITIYNSNCQYHTQQKLQQPKKQTKSSLIIQNQTNTSQQLSDSDQQALIISIVIVVVVLATGIGIIIGCKYKNKQVNNEQASDIVGEPPSSEQYHDEISMTSISHEQYEEGTSSRDI